MFNGLINYILVPELLKWNILPALICVNNKKRCDNYLFPVIVLELQIFESSDRHSSDSHSSDRHSSDRHSLDRHSLDLHSLDLHSSDLHSSDLHSSERHSSCWPCVLFVLYRGQESPFVGQVLSVCLEGIWRPPLFVGTCLYNFSECY